MLSQLVTHKFAFPSPIYKKMTSQIPYLIADIFPFFPIPQLRLRIDAVSP